MEKQSFLIVSVLLSLLGTIASAQSLPEIDNQAQPKADIQLDAEVVAHVNIFDAVIKSQKDNQFTVEFILANGEGAQADVQNRIRLIEKDKDGLMNIVDEKIYDQVIILGDNSETRQKIEYAAPEYLKGEFELWVEAGNSRGFLLGIASLGKVSLKGTGSSISVIPDSCQVNISGDEEKYHLNQGVDIAPEEELFLRCELFNDLDQTVNLSSSLATRHRSSFGQPAKGVGLEKQAIVLGGKEKKLVSWKIPKPEIPQAYDCVVTITNDLGKVVTGPIVAHYVLRGESATITSFQLDKNSYLKGEISKILLLWSASADNFPQSRGGGTQIAGPTFDLTIRDGSGKNCVQPIIKKPLDLSDNTVRLALPVILDCPDPKVAVSVTNKDGKILDERVLSFGEKKKEEEKKVSGKTVEKGLSLMDKIVLGSFGLFLAILLGMIFFRYRKRRVPLAMLGLFFLSALFLAGEKEAKAESWTVYNGGGGYTEFTVNLNKRSYASGETISVSGSSHTAICRNEATVRAYADGRYLLGLNIADGVGGFSTYHYYASGSTTTTASSGCGSGNVRVNMYFNHNAGGWVYASATGYIGYGLPSCRVNGACGTSNNNSFASAPISSLCSAGTATAMSGNGDNASPWQWRCSGIGGGSDSGICSAYRFPTLTFTADPAAINEGESSVLSWTADNAQTCTASSSWSGSKNNSGGTESFSPVSASVPWTYGLSCANAIGGTVGPVNQTVTVFGNPTVNLSAVPASITVNDSTNSTHQRFLLSWSTTNVPVGNNCQVATIVGMTNAGTLPFNWSSPDLKIVNVGGSGSQSIEPNGVGAFVYGIQCKNSNPIPRWTSAATVVVGVDCPSGQRVFGGICRSCSKTSCTKSCGGGVQVETCEVSVAECVSVAGYVWNDGKCQKTESCNEQPCGGSWREVTN